MISRILKLAQKYGGGRGGGSRIVLPSPSNTLASLLDAIRYRTSIFAIAPFWDSLSIPELCLSGAGSFERLGHGNGGSDGDLGAAATELPLWFAAPKKQVTRHKKRLKTTVQKRIPLRTDIVVDPRTGQVTRKHRLPFNWKDYLIEPSSSSSTS
jgi:ribosomal protein L32